MVRAVSSGMGLIHFVRGCVSGVVLLLCMFPRLTIATSWAAFLGGTVSVVAADEPAEPRRTYNLPRGDASTTLRQFAGLLGRQVLFLSDKVRGEQTNALAGDYTPREALDRMLANTSLIALEDTATGGFVVSRRPPPVPRTEVGPEKPTQPQPQSDPMTSTKQPGKLRPWLLALFGSIGAVIAPAQTAPNSETTSADTKPEEEVLVLSPFVVSTQEEDSYTARDTLAGNRVRTNLSDVGSSVQVVTKKFLDDTNSKRAEDLLPLITSMEVSGQGGNFLGQGDGAYLTTPPSFVPATRVRGLDSADTTQNFFLTRVPFDSYNVGRVDIQRGPNSILFGIGKPGGIVNATYNDAQFSNRAELEAQVGSFGSWRNSVDLNRVLIQDELAVKIAALDDETKYRQSPAFRDDRRIYGSLRWEPEFLNRGSAHTTLLVRTEHGKIAANAPMMTPPTDVISTYFTDPYFRNTDGTLKTYPSHVGSQYAPGEPSNPWIGTGASAPAVTAYEANGNPGVSFYTNSQHWPDPTLSDVADPMGAIGNAIYPTIETYEYFANMRSDLPFRDLKPYKMKSLSDASIFNFYDQLIYGPNAREESNFDVHTVDLAQTFFNGKAGVDLTYNRETSRFSSGSVIVPDRSQLTIDIASTLPDGTVNPNVGRPYINLAAGGNGAFSEEKRETTRLTGFVEVDFGDMLGRDSRWAKILGRHVFTGLVDRYIFNSDNRDYSANYIAPNPNNWYKRDPASHFVYLGPKINTLSSPSGLNLSPVTGPLQLSSTTFNIWNNQEQKHVIAPLSYVNNLLQPDASRRYNSASLLRNEIDSQVVTWQGYLFDGLLVPLVGYRTDKEEQSSFSAAAIPETNGGVDVSPLTYRLPSTKATTKGHSNTFSLVAHLPKSFRERLPGRLNISPFYNESENFQPSAGRIDLYGTRLPDPKGKTREYGVTLSALDDKVVFRFTHFDTKATDVTLPGNNIPGAYLVFLYAYGQDAYLHWTNPTRGSAASLNAFPNVVGVTSSGKELYMGISAAAPFTQEQIDAQYVIQEKTLASWATTVVPNVPQSLLDTWGLTNFNDPDLYFPNFSINPNVAVTSDTESKGTEWELSANPIPGLVVSLNAAYVTASVTNYAKTFLDAFETVRQIAESDAGNIQMFRGYPYDYFRSSYYSFVLPNLSTLVASEGRQSPEIRPWRFNGTVDYTFQTGRLKNVQMGGSYRWQDGNIVGYPVITVDGKSKYDVDHPYIGTKLDAVDLWVGYQRKVGKNLRWKTRVNVRNAFASDKLQVVNVQPDGSPAGLRIPEPRVLSWTNTFEF